MTKTPRKLPIRRLLFVVPRAAQALDLVGPMEAFDAVNKILAHEGKPARYTLELAAARRRVPTIEGLVVEATPLARAEPAHTLIVGGSADLIDQVPPKAELKAIEAHARRATRVVACCNGAFILGELGLLDDRRCTAHWLGLDALRTRFPRARVEDDSIYTTDGPIFTSAGGSAAIDLALHIISLDLGPKMALAVARLLVVFLHRPGGQSQFSTLIRSKPTTDERLRGLVARIVSSPGATYRVEHMAKRLGMSPRNFSRVFREQMQQTPAAFVAQVRIDAVRRALEIGDDTTASLASEYGFGNEETLRRAFHRALGVAPSEYRQRFQRSSER